MFGTRVFAKEGNGKELVLDRAGPELTDRVLMIREECRH